MLKSGVSPICQCNDLRISRHFTEKIDQKYARKIALGNPILRVQVNKEQRVGAPPRKFFFRGSNLPPLGGPPSQIESARHRYFWPKWAAKVTHRINKAFQKPIF